MLKLYTFLECKVQCSCTFCRCNWRLSIFKWSCTSLCFDRKLFLFVLLAGW